MLIHQIWLSNEIPKHIQVWMKTWENVGEYKLWRRKDIDSYYEIILRARLAHLHPALQSDLLRLLIMQDYGGFYIDCDCELLKPMPIDLPNEFVGHWFEGADPFIIKADKSSENIKFMIESGYSRPDILHEIYRWGYVAFNKLWPGNVVDVQDWCIHRSQHSWG